MKCDKSDPYWGWKTSKIWSREIDEPFSQRQPPSVVWANQLSFRKTYWDRPGFGSMERRCPRVEGSVSTSGEGLSWAHFDPRLYCSHGNYRTLRRWNYETSADARSLANQRQEREKWIFAVLVLDNSVDALSESLAGMTGNAERK